MYACVCVNNKQVEHSYLQVSIRGSSRSGNELVLVKFSDIGDCFQIYFFLNGEKKVTNLY